MIVINETAARRFWPGENPVGQRILLPDGGSDGSEILLTVAGVTGDVRQSGLGSAPRPEIFLNTQQPAPAWSWLTLVLRTSGDPAALAGTVKDLARSVDRDVPISEVAARPGEAYGE